MQANRESLQKAYPGIVSVLSTLSQMGVYGPIDRIAGALTPDAIKNALYDATRSIEAMIRQSSKVKVEDAGESEIEIVFWTSDTSDPRYRLALEGKLSGVIKGSDELKGYVGRRIRYIRVPFLPSREEIENFLKEIEEKGFKGLSMAKEIALISLSPYSKVGGKK